MSVGAFGARCSVALVSETVDSVLSSAATPDGPIWTPTPAQVASARLTVFREQLISNGIIPSTVTDSGALQRWSVDHPAEFWQEVWRAANVIADGPGSADAPYARVLTDGGVMRPRDESHGPQWFTGARLNFAEQLLRRREDHVAVVSWDEHGRRRQLTCAELARDVARAAQAMRELHVQPGDRVAGYLPNVIDAVVAMLATVSLGAVWSSCSPDFGTNGVLDRFGQIAPVLLIAADGYQYAGKRIDCRPRVTEIVSAIPSIRATWIVPWLETDADISSIPGAARFDDVIGAHADVHVPTFVRLPFDHPLYVMYSSGTTGMPKCIVHGAGGTLLQHWKEHALHTDLGANDTLFYFTTCGWMMWNWLVSALALGTTIVLYDGSPMAPQPDVLWQMAESERVTVFGTSAKYLATLEKESVVPKSRFNLSALKAILSTGSPLAATSYDYVYRGIKADLRLASISGGTDIISCFALGDPTRPVYRGELQIRGLGMAVDVWDADGQAVIGQAGELVCTKPFPSMPIGFWNDPDGALYRKAYFEHWPGVWRHGDWAEITPHDGLIIHGRSDATLNPGGVRIGTAEIYRQVEQIPEVLESVVVEQHSALQTGESRMVLFVKLRPGLALTDELQRAIRGRLRTHASPHHVPREIVAVHDIPRTLSGKISEIAVREAVHGRAIGNVDALANPDSIEVYREFAARHQY